MIRSSKIVILADISSDSNKEFSHKMQDNITIIAMHANGMSYPAFHFLQIQDNITRRESVASTRGYSWLLFPA